MAVGSDYGLKKPLLRPMFTFLIRNKATKCMSSIETAKAQRLRNAIQLDRLLETAVRLIEVPSPTRSAAAAADRLAEILQEDGFQVERPAVGSIDAPAVVARHRTDRDGRTIQFSGHLDTVHLPFVAPRVEGGMLYGSGASDMKGGLAAAIEAMRALRDADALPCGAILLTAYDLHEAPWGDGSQLRGLIDAGFVGDGVLLPEYLCDRLPLLGRGTIIFKVHVTRDGVPIHEVIGGIEQPSVIGAGAELIRRFGQLDRELAQRTHPLGARESMFIGQIQAGEIYNQSPTELELSGTRRWLPGTKVEDVTKQFNEILGEVANQFGVSIEGQIQSTSHAFEIARDQPLVAAFQSSYQASTGSELAIGAKPFTDDGNSFVLHGGVPAITHGPNAKGAHTVNEQVPVDELERVALVYALTATEFCGAG